MYVSLPADDGDNDSFANGPELKLVFDDAGQLVYLFMWADNVSINRSGSVSGVEGVENEVKIDVGRNRGKAGMKKAQTLGGADISYRFEAQFDVELLKK